MKYVFDPFTKHDLELVGNHRGQMFLVVGHQIFAHISGGVLSHSSLQIISKSLRFGGWCLSTLSFGSLHRLSMGWRSGHWLQVLNVLLLEPLLCCLGCVLGHCHAGIPLHDPFSMPWPWQYMAPSIVSLMQCSDFFCFYSVSHCSSNPTIKMIDWSCLFQRANIQNQQAINSFFFSL